MSKNKSPRRHEGMNARAPLTSLTRSHAQRGWGGFDRCMTYAMQGLAVCLPSKSAEGRTTAYQVAMASHITDRWAREGLKRLESAGLISWERGGSGPDGCARAAAGGVLLALDPLAEVDPGEVGFLVHADPRRARAAVGADPAPLPADQPGGFQALSLPRLDQPPRVGQAQEGRRRRPLQACLGVGWSTRRVSHRRRLPPRRHRRRRRS